MDKKALIRIHGILEFMEGYMIKESFDDSIRKEGMMDELGYCINEIYQELIKR